MERLTKRNFNFTSNYVASHLQSWSIAQALSRLQEYEDKLEDLGLTFDELISKISHNGEPSLSPKNALAIRKLLDGKNWGYAYVFREEFPEVYAIDMSPRNIANFLMSCKDVSEVLLTDPLDNEILNSIGGFLDRIRDMQLRAEILEHLVPMQMGHVNPENVCAVDRDLFDRYCEQPSEVKTSDDSAAKHPLHSELARTAFLAKRGKHVKVGNQEVTEYGCPHCGYEWLEYSDMPEYPYHCPGCGESLWQEEVPEEPAAESDKIITDTAADPDEVFITVKNQISKGYLTTAFGDVQALCALPNGRTLEFTVEKAMLPPENHHYSVQLHCSEMEYDNGCYEQSVGVIRSFSSAGTDDASLKDLIQTVLHCNKYTPVKI